MNIRLLAKVLGWLLILESVAMAGCGLFAWADPVAGDRPAMMVMLTSAGLTALAGLLLLISGIGRIERIPRREAVLIVGLGWLLCGVFGGIPFVLSEPGLTFGGAFFESVSGFTTTGSTAIADLNEWPRGLLMWRAVTQWLGGLGILVLFVALLSYLGIGSKSLFRNESSFATGEATTARIRDTALLLWKVYLLITIACLLGLRAMGLSWFDAVTHTFAAVSTGGFSNYNNSIGFYGDWGNAALIEGWLIIFMTACSLNFLIYVLVARRKWKRLRDEEDGRWFVVMCLASAVAIAAGVAATSDQSFLRALRDGLFTVVTIASTTGFCTADYDRWPTYARIILALLMIVGGCAGSTAGGLKIGRLLVFFKASLHEIVKVFRPHQVFRLHVNGNPLGLDARAQVMMFIALYGAIICISTLLVTVLELGRPISMETAFGSVVATLSNIGPGFDAVGPTANFAGLRAVTQAFLGLLMVIGRLELYAILVLFIPAVWRKY